MKSGTGSDEPKNRRYTFQSFADPSPTNALRFAPRAPSRYARFATIVANTCHGPEVATTWRSSTSGGSYPVSSRSAFVSASGSAGRTDAGTDRFTELPDELGYKQHVATQAAGQPDGEPSRWAREVPQSRPSEP